MTTSRFTLGLGRVLADAESQEPLGFCRDDILAHLTEQIADGTGDDRYELRELLSSELPLSSDDGAHHGELLVATRADRVGGPLRRTEADRVIALVDAVGRSGKLSASFPFLHPRTVIAPPPCVNGPLRFGESHPLHDVFVVSAVAAGAYLDQLAGDVECFRRLLTLCADEKLPIAVVRDYTA
ncbi:MAG: hypothetical protein JO257_34855 [Deltaproteobacteria bacterium]|nr:hypothetical protein [Deltaproteobacteria bacterium]